MDSARKGTGLVLFSSSYSVFCILWVAGLDFFLHCFWMTKAADIEGISFPEPAELAEPSPRPFARMREMPPQHSPFQRSPLLPPARCKRAGTINRSRHSLQRTPAAVCAAGDVPRTAPCAHARPCAHVPLAASRCSESCLRLGTGGRRAHLPLSEKPHAISTTAPSCLEMCATGRLCPCGVSAGVGVHLDVPKCRSEDAGASRVTGLQAAAGARANTVGLYKVGVPFTPLNSI